MCPCHSGKPYPDCCEPFHAQKKLPGSAVELMRSRYSAYALGLVKYVIETTHPTNSLFLQPSKKIAEDILHFSLNTEFYGLEILEFIDGPSEAFVTFRAGLKQNSVDVSFVEKSRFIKDKGRWIYEKASQVLADPGKFGITQRQAKRGENRSQEG